MSRAIAHTNPGANLSRILSPLIATFRSLGNVLIAIAEAGPRMEAIRRLNAMSDKDLHARGLTREGEVRRIFGDHFYF